MPVLLSTDNSANPAPACPLACLAQIQQATASFAFPSAMPTVKAVQTSKESTIPFGSGSTRNDDWEDLAGLTTYIDSTKYGQIKSVVFEAAVQIPNGNQGAYVRLYNVTDRHPVWYSEMYLEGGLPKLLTSPSLTLDSGNKQYQVQMKTTLKDLAVLNQARIRITSQF